MPPVLDPKDAEQALATVAEQRRRMVTASRPPWWTWPLTFAILIGLGASQDAGGQVRNWVGLAVSAALLGWMALSRLSPASAERSGLGMRAMRRRLMPRRWYALIMAVLLAAGAAILGAGSSAAHWLTRAGAPAWAVHHPHTVVGVAVAALLTGLAWLTGLALSARPGGNP